MIKEPIEEYYEKCLEYIKEIQNPILKDCCQNIYEDYKEKLINKPATTGYHHYYKGGLLFHTYCVTRNALAICNLYSELEIDLDLILFGSLLHDIGKTNDYSNSSKDGATKIGNGAELLGHLYEGTHIVATYLTNYEIDEEFKNQVLHTIDSHMNEFSEWGCACNA